MVYKRGDLKVLLGPEKHIDLGYSSDEEVQENVKKPSPNGEPGVFEKIGETNIYKRTRPFQPVQPRPKLEKWPSFLQLSGTKMHREESMVDSEKGEIDAGLSRENSGWKLTTPIDARWSSPLDFKHQNNLDTTHNSSIAAHSSSPSLRKRWSRYTAPAHGSRVSRYYLNDFGLKVQRTDSFSGHHRRRSVASSEMRKQMEQNASKHIRTCQGMGNVKRGCRAQLSYMGLRDAVSPLSKHHGNKDTGERNAHPIVREKSFTHKHGQLAGMIQIRKNAGLLPRIQNVASISQKNDPLPEISGRTLILGSVVDI